MTQPSSHPLVLWGGGQMGKEIEQLLGGNDFSELSFNYQGTVISSTPTPSAQSLVESAEVVIDFSHFKATEKLFSLLDSLSSTRLSEVLIGTTGLSDACLEKAKLMTEKHGLKTLIAPNTSLGVMVLYQTIRSWMKLLGDKNFDVELIEQHHHKKHDAPSGTAKLLLSCVTEHPQHQQGSGTHPSHSPREKGFVGTHAMRGGGVYGSHSLHFMGQDETLSLSHSAISRTLFAKGALTMAHRLRSMKPGFYRYHDLPPDFLSSQVE